MCSPVKSLLALAAVASGVLAQAAQQCPSIGGAQASCYLWFSNANCASPETNASLVVTRAGQCNLVPSSFAGVPFSSYYSTCAESGSAGVVYYCASATCDSATCTSSPFTSGSCQAKCVGRAGRGARRPRPRPPPPPPPPPPAALPSPAPAPAPASSSRSPPALFPPCPSPPPALLTAPPSLAPSQAQSIAALPRPRPPPLPPPAGPQPPLPRC